MDGLFSHVRSVLQQVLRSTPICIFSDQNYHMYLNCGYRAQFG